MATETKKNRVLDAETSYLKIGSTVYKLAKVAHPIEKVEDEIKSYYSNLYEASVKDTTDLISQQASTEWDTQLRKMQEVKTRASASITLPPEYKNKIIIYTDGWRECRSIIYNPTNYLMDIAKLKGLISPERFTALKTKYPFLSKNGNTSILIQVAACPTLLVCTLAYSPKFNNITTPGMRTFHTLQSNILCTGNASAKRVWAMPHKEFTEYINTVNCFSLATSTVQLVGSGSNVSIYDLTKVFSDNKNIVSILEEGESAWKIA